MPDDKTAVPAPAGPAAGAATEATAKAPEQPVVIAKPAPPDELGDTLDQFFASFQSSGLKTMKTILTQFKDKADAVITKLDGDAGSDTKKP